MNKIGVAFWVFLFLNISDVNAQSGWTRQKGGFYAKTGFSTLSGDKYYDVEGKILPNARVFNQQMLAFYGEYGLTKNITGVLNYPFMKWQHYDDFETVAATANPQLELRFALYKKIPVVSFAVGAELPISKQNNISQAKIEIAPGVRESVNLPSGYEDFNYWGTLAVSSGFGNTPGWLTISGQLVKRGKDYSNQARLGFELGYKWTPQFWTNARLTGLYQVKKSGNTSAGSLTNGEATEYTILNIGLAYEVLPHWSITADYQTYNTFLVSLKNVYSAPFYQIGTSVEF